MIWKTLSQTLTMPTVASSNLTHPGQLKEGIAEVGTGALTHPRIKFFADKNPDWRSGVELACIAEMTFLMPSAG